jgi:putative phosphoserine phosphatase/1-acylglycerol-3-phosphate O-acyltransferase
VQTIIQMLRPTGRTTRALGKKEIFDLPGIGALATALGGIPVDRTGGGAESFENAAVALEGGELVCLLPQGTIPRGARFYDPVLKGRTGAARLAAMTRAPVIPFGIWGSELVWPRSSPVPRVLNVLDPPTVRVRVGPPVELKYRSAAADTRRIMEAIVDCLPPEAREHRVPTEEEVRLATP